MKKVLVISNMYPDKQNPAYGIFVENFTDQLNELDISFDKVVMHKGNSKLEKLSNYLFFFFKAFFTILFNRYEMIYVHYPSISGIPVLGASLFKKLRIYTNVHGTDVLPVSNLEKKLAKNTAKLLNMSEKAIVPSKYYQSILEEKYIIPKEQILVYPSGGIDTTVFYPQEVEVTTSEKIVFGFVGRIIETKGWKVLTDALELLYQDTPEMAIELLIIGDGSDANAFKEALKQVNSNLTYKRIPFVPQTDLNGYYSQMDALIFPTYKESLGLVALEAMACGTPVIGSDIPPLNDYIRHHHNGLLFEKRSANKLKNEMKYFITLTQAEREQLSTEALVSAQKYSQENVMAILKEIFN